MLLQTLIMTHIIQISPFLSIPRLPLIGGLFHRLRPLSLVVVCLHWSSLLSSLLSDITTSKESSEDFQAVFDSSQTVFGNSTVENHRMGRFQDISTWVYALHESGTRDTVHLFSHGPSPARKAIGPERRRRYEWLRAEINAMTDQGFDGYGIWNT